MHKQFFLLQNTFKHSQIAVLYTFNKHPAIIRGVLGKFPDCIYYLNTS